MGTSYPGAIDAFASIAEDTYTDVGFHRAHHNDANDAIEALEAKLGIGSDTPVLGDVLIGTAAGSSGWLADRVFDARLYGALGDNTGNDAPAINAAFAAADAAGGGFVYLPAGTYRLTSSLIIASTYGIGLVGPIGSGWLSMASGRGGAILNWAGGASEMLIIRPAVNAGNWPAHNVHVENLAFQGNDLATQAIHIEALKHGVFKNLTLFKTTDAGLWVGGTSVSGYIGNQHTYNCILENISINQYHGSGSGRGMALGQTTPDARFFFNTFTNTEVRCLTGTAMDLIAVDHCTFDTTAAATDAPNYSVILQGQAVNYNIFLNLWPHTGGLLAKGTETGTGGASGRNTIFGYSMSDNAPRPRKDRGAGLVVYYHDGDPTPQQSLVHATNGANTNYFVKIASGRITAQYEQHSGAIELGSYGTVGAGFYAHVDFRVQQNAAINGSNQPVIDLLVKQKQGWVAADISIVVTNVTTTVDWEMWVKLPTAYTTVLVTPEIASYGNVDWLEAQTPVSARSAGTATGGTSV